ncbi:hypothetical protein [Aliikangiella maris]|uniref:Uncharacterized protein n=2 Tax=Aliikangiella maris TaxID=3162458 RepID=A0ABV3MM06_9GAMM
MVNVGDISKPSGGVVANPSSRSTGGANKVEATEQVQAVHSLKEKNKNKNKSDKKKLKTQTLKNVNTSDKNYSDNQSSKSLQAPELNDELDATYDEHGKKTVSTHINITV